MGRRSKKKIDGNVTVTGGFPVTVGYSQPDLQYKRLLFYKIGQIEEENAFEFF